MDHEPHVGHSHCYLPYGWPGVRHLIVQPELVEPNLMYLVILPTEGTCPYLFFWADPRSPCPHSIIEGADFIDLPARDDFWEWGGKIPLDDMHPHFLARSRRQPKKFKAFRGELDVQNSREIVDGVAEVWSTREAFERRGYFGQK